MFPECLDGARGEPVVGDDPGDARQGQEGDEAGLAELRRIGQQPGLLGALAHE